MRKEVCNEKRISIFACRCSGISSKKVAKLV